jgi:transcription initiation factor TFIIB
MHRGRQTHPRRELLLTAAALYIACIMNEENRTQKMIAEAAGVTEVTIRNRYTELKSVLDLDI